MTKLKRNQSIVTKIESEVSKLLLQTKLQLVTTLRDYVEAADYGGVKSNRKLLVTKLQEKYKSINELPDAKREDLFLCIIGNFIGCVGNPPPNVMLRFCNEFINSARRR